MEEKAYHQARRSLRVPSDTRVKIADSDVKRLVPVLNISQDGALLRSSQVYEAGAIIELEMHSPYEPEVVYVSARVVRIVEHRMWWGRSFYDIGVEFIR